MKKDFIFTFLTQLIILLSGLAVFKLAMQDFGDVGFAQFSLVKRNSTYIYTFIMIGLGVSIPRYVATEIGKKSGNESNVFLSAFILLTGSLLLIGILMILFKQYISFLLFGAVEYTKFLIPIYISILGLAFHALVYSYYRGKMLFNYSNYLQIINLGIVPIVVFLFSQSIEDVFIYSGLAMIVISIVLFVRILIYCDFDLSVIKTFVLELFVYGIQRLPADFGLASLIALPSMLAVHVYGVTVAGYMAFSISLLNLSGQAVAPIGLIMLPKISHLIGSNKIQEIVGNVRKLFLVSIVVAVAGTLIYQIFTEEILKLYLGSVPKELILISKQIMWAALFYPFYVVMRSVVDAYYKRAYNTVSVIFALIIFLIVYLFSNNIYYSIITSMITLSLSTFYFIKPLLFRAKL